LEYHDAVKQKLNSLIAQMSSTHECFVKNPGKDFIRNRKLSFETMIKLLISMGGNSLSKELLEAHGYKLNTPTTSAFVQQRDKILPSALKFLFEKFTDSAAANKRYNGYKLLAFDGTDLRIAADTDNPDNYFRDYTDKTGYGLLQFNAMYDLLNRVYVDTCIQAGRYMNENKALTTVVDQSRIDDKVIVIGDRGYESYNNMAHIEKKGWKYLIRVKDTGGGIQSGLPIHGTDEFDASIHKILTRKFAEFKENPDLYRYIANGTKLDFMDKVNSPHFQIIFRIVRFKITEDSYETVITNLATSDFPPEELKKLYNLRWGIETAFRELKYTIGLLNFHAKKEDYIMQEIYSRMIMYNFSEIIISNVIVARRTGNKHSYQVNFTVATHVCRRFLRCRSNSPPLNVKALICKNILPLRPGRQAVRRKYNRKVVSFTYRVA